MAKKRRQNNAKATLGRRKQLLIGGTTMAAVIIVVGLVLLAAQTRKGEDEIKIDPAEAGTGITEDGFPYQGSLDAPVTFIEYSDYLCGHCKNFALEKEPRIVNEYVKTGQVRYIYHYYALGEAQVLLGEAAHCAADQGHFWEYHKVMFENQSRFREIGSLEDLEKLLVEFAQQASLDVPAFETCWGSHQHQETIIESIQAAREIGVGGTPTFSIQGELLVGNQPYEAFQRAIEKALSETEQ